MPIQTEDDAKFVADKIRDGTLTGESKERAFADLEAFKSASAPTNRGALSVVTDFAQGSRLGLKNARAGAEQLYNTAVTGARGALGIAEDGEAEEAQQRGNELKSEIALRDLKISKLGLPGKGGAIVGETLPSMALPGGPTGAIGKRIAGGIAADTIASVADPVREDETRLGNLERAATGSALFRGAGGLASSAFKRLSNAKAGNYANDDIRALIDHADANDIPVFFDDATQAPLALKLSTAAEYFGRVGTGSGRAKQNEKALAAANNFLDKFSGDFDNYDEIVQEGLKRKLNVFKSAAAKKYARVMNEIAKSGPVEPLSTKGFDAAADAGIAAEIAKGTRANKDVVDFLQKYKDAPRGNFEEMIEFRSDLLADVRNMSDDVNFTSTKALMQAQEALDNDMAEYARKHGAEGLWRDANNFYKNTVLQFKVGKLKNMVNDKSAANFDAQSAWKYLASNQSNPKRARLMWQSLDADGRAAVRFGLLDEALDAATKEGAPFSPAKFAGSLEKRMPVAEEFFRGATGDELKGLVKVMRHIERAGRYAEDPPTGARVIPWLLAGSTYVEPTTAAATGAAALSIKGAFQTKFGRDLLLAANKSTPGSKEFDKILEAIERAASRGSN